VAKASNLALDLAMVVFPLLSLLFATPIVTEVLPFELDSGQLHAQFWIIGVAAAAGVISAPGYLFALIRGVNVRHLGIGPRVWVLSSLGMAALACAAAVPFTLSRMAARGVAHRELGLLRLSVHDVCPVNAGAPANKSFQLTTRVVRFQKLTCLPSRIFSLSPTQAGVAAELTVR
jgi:hypothetical protein